MKIISTLIIVFSFVFSANAQKPVNWTPAQLMPPAALAKMINAKKVDALVLSIGPSALIPGSEDIGMAGDKKGKDKLKAKLASLDKSRKIVVYCGCCPYSQCPNVRPAVALLKELKFTNYYLLDLPNNFKVDWIDKKYPTQKM